MSAVVDGNLWEFNVAQVIVVDVSDDYRFDRPCQSPECYPVVEEVWIPRCSLPNVLAEERIIEGFLYDWHQSPRLPSGAWYVGVVNREMLVKPARS
jgi:hypothetical protein